MYKVLEPKEPAGFIDFLNQSIYITQMRLSVELSEEKAEILNQSAQKLGVEPTELANALLLDQLGNLKGDFEASANHVLKKNAELYQRLS